MDQAQASHMAAISSCMFLPSPTNTAAIVIYTVKYHDKSEGLKALQPIKNVVNFQDLEFGDTSSIIQGLIAEKPKRLLHFFLTQYLS